MKHLIFIIGVCMWPPRIWGVINSIPNHHWDCRWCEGERKLSISVQYEKPVTRFSYYAISVPPTSSITTEVAKRNYWCSGLRKQSPGSVEYHRPATTLVVHLHLHHFSRNARTWRYWNCLVRGIRDWFLTLQWDTYLVGSNHLQSQWW